MSGPVDGVPPPAHPGATLPPTPSPVPPPPPPGGGAPREYHLEPPQRSRGADDGRDPPSDARRQLAESVIAIAVDLRAIPKELRDLGSITGERLDRLEGEVRRLADIVLPFSEDLVDQRAARKARAIAEATAPVTIAVETAKVKAVAEAERTQGRARLETTLGEWGGIAAKVVTSSPAMVLFGGAGLALAQWIAHLLGVPLPGHNAGGP